MKYKNKKPILSVIIPVFNEEKTLEKIIEKVQKAEPKNKEIIIVDDFSVDNTRKILEKIKKENLKIIKHRENKGKGEAIKTGLKYCTGKITIIQDADLEYDPGDYENLISPILKGKTKTVYGSRFLENKNKKTRFYFGNRLLFFLASVIYNKKITDMETCYKAVETNLLKSLKLESKSFDIEPEITSKLIKKGYEIKEIPISYNPRTKQEGKKIKTKDGLQAIHTLIKYKLRKVD